MNRRGFLHYGVLVLAAVGLTSCGGRLPSPEAGADVLVVARAAGLDRFSRLIAQAGLTETLAGPGPYTLFVPTDGAFAAPETGRLDAEGLRRLLAYHVVPGQLNSDFLAGMDVNHTTLLGSSLNVDGAGPLRINGASVLQADLMASNGVVFVIDRVLEPR